MSDPKPIVQPRERVLGAVFVVIAICLHVGLMGPATSLLSLGLVVAYVVWAAAAWNPDPAPILALYLVGVSVQCLHLCEEYLTGFQHQFPRLFGYQWSDQRFLVFNLIWLLVFVVAALGVFLRFPLSYLVVFFYAIAGGIGNGLGHLLLSAVERRYFPGTLTAPLTLMVGAALLSRLLGGRRGETKPRE
jgi:hypothetical protein